MLGMHEGLKITLVLNYDITWTDSGQKFHPCVKVGSTGLLLLGLADPEIATCTDLGCIWPDTIDTHAAICT